MKRRLMGKVNRPEAVNPARNIGRRDAIKKRCRGQTMFFFAFTYGSRRDMIMGSKRRKSTIPNNG